MTDIIASYFVDQFLEEASFLSKSSEMILMGKTLEKLKNKMADIIASYFVDQFLEASFLSKSSEMILVGKTLAKLACISLQWKNKAANNILRPGPLHAYMHEIYNHCCMQSKMQQRSRP
jgi:hypothetical protein